MSFITSAWQSLPWIVRFVIDFWFVYILLKGVGGRDITQWLADNGLVREPKKSWVYRLLDFLYRPIITYSTIWRHEWYHHIKELGECSEPHCTRFIVQK